MRCPARVVAGITGGLAGGVVFGIRMQAWDMLPMVAMLLNSESVGVGWLVHLFNSALFGAVFAVLVGRWAATAVPAAVIGVVWWVLGALLIMPAWLGMNAMIFDLNTTAWRSLGGHLVYGLLLGLGVRDSGITAAPQVTRNAIRGCRLRRPAVPGPAR